MGAFAQIMMGLAAEASKTNESSTGGPASTTLSGHTLRKKNEHPMAYSLVRSR
jgi:hypothetical protein